jgi:hypothetical protein
MRCWASHSVLVEIGFAFARSPLLDGKTVERKSVTVPRLMVCYLYVIETKSHLLLGHAYFVTLR